RLRSAASSAWAIHVNGMRPFAAPNPQPPEFGSQIAAPALERQGAAPGQRLLSPAGATAAAFEDVPPQPAPDDIEHGPPLGQDSGPQSPQAADSPAEVQQPPAG